jgi:ABC-type transport system substrate-binding protein
MYILQTPSVDRNAVSYTPDNIPTAENRWRGSNRSGWNQSEYVRLAEQFISTLDPRERSEQVAQMARIYSEDVAAVSLYFPPAAWAWTAALKGPKDQPPDTNVLWDVQTWELR